MRIVSLNTWGGRVFDPLMEFVKREAPATDIFCFQEILFGDMSQADPHGIRENLYDEIAAVLSDFVGYPAPIAAGYILLGQMTVLPYIRSGMAMFVKKGISVLTDNVMRLFDGEFPTNAAPNTITGSMQYLQVENEDGVYTVAHVHGLWQLNGHKEDTPESLQQSTKVIEFFKQLRNRKILMGDFNLRPETQSILAFNNDFKNLIQDYGIENTRNCYYTDMEKYKDYIADYAFVSPDMTVQKFEVLPDEVSDHAPLLLECA